MTILEVILKKHAIGLLESLRSEPRRFTDLRKVVSNEKTLSARLKELKKVGVIESTLLKEKDRDYVAYTITSKGTETLKLVKTLENL